MLLSTAAVLFYVLTNNVMFQLLQILANTSTLFKIIILGGVKWYRISGLICFPLMTGGFQPRIMFTSPFCLFCAEMTTEVLCIFLK
jgi:hypothetical protein